MKQVVDAVVFIICITTLLSSSLALALTPPDRRIPTNKSSTLSCRINLESLQHRRHNRIHYQQRPCSRLNLVPFSEAWNNANNNVDDGIMHQSFASLLHNINCQSLDSDGMLISSFLSNEQKKKHYRLYLATNVDDLPPIAKLTLDVFDVSAIAMSNAVDWNAIEAALVGSVVAPAVSAYNSWAYSVGYTEVLSGLRSRMRNRITNACGEERKCNDWLAPLVPDNTDTSSYNSSNDMPLQDVASRSSLILALARTITPLDDNQRGKEEEIEVIASIELRLQPTDAKIPFSQPWLDVIERKLVRFTMFGKSINNPPLRPYLCNLCISPNFTRLGIGRALCRIVEAIARDKWSYSQIYLHVDPANDAAIQLYDTEGYVDVGSRWNAFWAGGANEISYLVKRLRTTGLDQ
jgi:ribosomal protein S18 acetylase RimI-like enzyme